ncbi:MAG TPA: tRNA preQ1(34) S-adenosylmethionine ribosyltransferase-isomerase QueA [Firmicutes bacterium]|nr:tRNA preQ1(34) S-adenosylmethionine ribosyltransferase-isomerase QueA [Bacillota bacterium]
MQTSDFEYQLPPELIAQHPVQPRDASRLLVLHRGLGLEHRYFRDLPEYLRPGDCLVLNDTRVLRARLFGRRRDTGGRVEFLLLRPLSDGRWETLVRPGRRARPGVEIDFSAGDCRLTATVDARTATGGRVVTFTSDLNLDQAIDHLGVVPLPPYITAALEDDERYQTVYAGPKGSVAAPTAGLHFTPALLEQIRNLGVQVAKVTLHVGLGTFRPVGVEDLKQHSMHAEYYQLNAETADLINSARRVVAVGTTVARTLETTADAGGQIRPGCGWTDLFIYPGYQFRAVDVLLTNFHLPRSSLLMLVCAFADREEVLAAYRDAVGQRYRFYSFGDAMLII